MIDFVFVFVFVFFASNVHNVESLNNHSELQLFEHEILERCVCVCLCSIFVRAELAVIQRTTKVINARLIAANAVKSINNISRSRRGASLKINGLHMTAAKT